MTWPKGQMRYNIATFAELRTFKPLSYTLDLDGETMHLDAMLVAVGNGPSFGGGLRITEGASLDDGMLDVVVIGPMSRTGLVRTYPKLFKGTHVTHPQYSHHLARSVTIASPGITTYADGERFGDLPLTVECAPGALTVFCMSRRTVAVGAVRRFRTHREHPVPATSPRSTSSRSTSSRSGPAWRSRTAAACWWPHRPARARPWSGEFAIHLALAQGRKCFYTTPIKALSNQKYHDLVARYGPERGRPADRRQRRQRRGAGGGDDHRGAAQHAVRRLADAARARATS